MTKKIKNTEIYQWVIMQFKKVFLSLFAILRRISIDLLRFVLKKNYGDNEFGTQLKT